MADQCGGRLRGLALGRSPRLPDVHLPISELSMSDAATQRSSGEEPSHSNSQSSLDHARALEAEAYRFAVDASIAVSQGAPRVDQAEAAERIAAISVPSLGSLWHGYGTCKPCHFAFTSRGCHWGKLCGLCHYRHPRRRVVSHPGPGDQECTESVDSSDPAGGSDAITLEAKAYRYAEETAEAVSQGAQMVDQEEAAEKIAAISVPSLGSLSHGYGTCKPCQFAFTSRGCHWGKLCGLCHYKHPRRHRAVSYGGPGDQD